VVNKVSGFEVCVCVCENSSIEGGGIEKVDLWVVWGLGLFLGLFWCWVCVVFEVVGLLFGMVVMGGFCVRYRGFNSVGGL